MVTWCPNVVAGLSGLALAFASFVVEPPLLVLLTAAPPAPATAAVSGLALTELATVVDIASVSEQDEGLKNAKFPQAPRIWTIHLRIVLVYSDALVMPVVNLSESLSPALQPAASHRIMDYILDDHCELSCRRPLRVVRRRRVVSRALSMRIPIRNHTQGVLCTSTSG